MSDLTSPIPPALKSPRSPDGLDDVGKRKRMRKVIVTAGIGHFVEWFDFGLYGTLAAAIAFNFFKAGDPAAALVAAFAVFGAGFVMRPLGGLFFGSLGDRIGRRTVLAAVIITTSAATVAMGLLPTYAMVGLVAPILLVAVRLIQGFAAGGESAGATTLLAEYAPSNRRGFMASFIDVWGFGGFLVAAALALTLSATTSPDALNAWGWRVLFLIAAPLGLIGLYLRVRLEETPEFKALKAKNEVNDKPLRSSIRFSWRALLFCAGFVILKGVGHWTLQTFMPSYLQTYLHYNATTAFGATVVSFIVIIVLVPVFGALSDRIGRKPVMLIGCGGFLVATYPALVLMGTGHFWAATAALLVLGVFMAAFDGAMNAAMAELFPTNIRYGGMAIAYNIAVAIFGGATPYFAAFLIGATGSNLAPAFYVMAAALITGLVVLRARETAHAPLRAE